MNLSIFDLMYPRFEIKNKVRLIELFAGYGSQNLALKYLNVDYESWKICEWAIKSIQAYKDIHYANCNDDYSKDLPIEKIIDYLYKKGVSQNYNEPLDYKQITRLSEKQLRTIYNNIQITKNLVNIQQVKGSDLEIVDTENYTYLLTYSFPCQDLSLAGTRKLMSDTSTRSGMLWEVERILFECKDLGTLPQVLVMENVPQVHGEGAKEDFIKWQLRLEELGYKNYWQDLIATDYGIPQTRNRCFMVSILGDYVYSFPKPIPLKLKLKDMLEDNSKVSEKYYLSDKMLNYCISTNKSGKWDRSKDFLGNLKRAENGVSGCLTTATGSRATDTYILTKNANSKGYLEAREGDGVDISTRMEYHRGTVQKGKAQTITTAGGNNCGVVVRADEETLKRELCNKLIQAGLVEEGDVVKHSYTSQILDGNKKCVEKNDGNMITLTTRGDCVGVCVGTYQFAKSDNFIGGKDRLQLGKETSDTIQTSQKEAVVIGNYMPSNHNASRIVDPDYSAPTVMECHGTVTAVQKDLRIRKLMPIECFRLMGVRDKDFYNCAKNQTDSSLYHLAGDSIVVDVLMAIFRELY